jgi:hypothetical protein
MLNVITFSCTAGRPGAVDDALTGLGVGPLPQATAEKTVTIVQKEKTFRRVRSELVRTGITPYR